MDGGAQKCGGGGNGVCDGANTVSRGALASGAPATRKHTPPLCASFAHVAADALDVRDVMVRCGVAYGCQMPRGGCSEAGGAPRLRLHTDWECAPFGSACVDAAWRLPDAALHSLEPLRARRYELVGIRCSTLRLVGLVE